MVRFCEDQLEVRIHRSRVAMGVDAATFTAAKIRSILAEHDSVALVFAAAPSQNEFLDALVAFDGVSWGRVDAFHMDEYVGLPGSHPQSFVRYLDDRLFSRVPFRTVYRIQGDAQDPESECERYAELLSQGDPQIVCMGIGENGHIAFNDPPVADFDDPKLVKVVELDAACKEQQVHDGCFPSADLVPSHAITLTVPALMRPAARFCVAPGKSKRVAVERALEGPVSTACPASALRTKAGTTLFLDSMSGAKYWNDQTDE